MYTGTTNHFFCYCILQYKLDIFVYRKVNVLYIQLSANFYDTSGISKHVNTAFVEAISDENVSFFRTRQVEKEIQIHSEE